MVVSIYGGSGVGKSSLSKRVVEILGEDIASRVPADHFLLPRKRECLDEYLSRPLQYDWDLLALILAKPASTEVTAPDFDFATFERKSTSGMTFYVREYMVIDSMVPYPKADVFIKVVLPDNLRKQRIILRDREWNSRVINLWENHQLTLRAVEALHLHPVLTLDGHLTVGENAHHIVEVLAGY